MSRYDFFVDPIDYNTERREKVIKPALMYESAQQRRAKPFSAAPLQALGVVSCLVMRQAPAAITLGLLVFPVLDTLKGINSTLLSTCEWHANLGIVIRGGHGIRSSLVICDPNITLDDAETKEVDEIVKSISIEGMRYPDFAMDDLEG